MRKFLKWAARLLGLERPVFYEKLREFGLSN